MTVIGIGVIMSIFFSGGDSKANVEMQGDDNKSVVQQSAGFHVLEVNNSGVVRAGHGHNILWS
jgi:hypothetical protein